MIIVLPCNRESSRLSFKTQTEVSFIFCSVCIHRYQNCKAFNTFKGGSPVFSEFD